MARRTYSARYSSPLGIGEDFITFSLQSRDFVHLIDRVKKKFIGGGFQHALGRANEGAAIHVQESIAEALDRAIKDHRTRARTRRPGERMRTAILDRENREVFANTFRVGIPAWYDRSPVALYWRIVEETGTEPYTTFGFFVNPGVVGPRPSPTGQLALSQISRKKMGNGRKPPVIHVGAFDAYHYHRVGVVNGLSTLNMGQRYLRELVPLGLVMQIRTDAFGTSPSLNFGYTSG